MPIKLTADDVARSINDARGSGVVQTAGKMHRDRCRRSPLPAELPAEAVTILVDSREQMPLAFPGFRIERATLDTGDYSAAGFESAIAIERKSLPDLLACCGRDRERFDREVSRLMAFPVRSLVIEADWPDIEAGRWRSQIKPAAVLGSLVAWHTRGLPVVMAGNRNRAAELIAAIIMRAIRDQYRTLRELARHLQNAG